MAEVDEARCETVIPNQKFWALLAAAHKESVLKIQTYFTDRTFIGLDPGETTGTAIWDRGQIHLRQLDTCHIGRAYDRFSYLITSHNPQHLRYEDYKVYSWKADDHIGASLHTPQVIGAIKVAAHLHDIPVSSMMAQQAKAFWTDEKLTMCGLYAKGQKHARDAERHLLYLMSTQLS